MLTSRAVLVQCGESAYINSRPFRVNAGPVHAYVHAAGERTAYLCELSAGSQVTIVDAQGRTREALVGRCKVRTPMRYPGPHNVCTALQASSVREAGYTWCGGGSGHCVWNKGSRLACVAERELWRRRGARLQVERRPMVLVRAEVQGGDAVSVILQNAETVKLVCPAAPQAATEENVEAESASSASPFVQALEEEPQQVRVEEAHADAAGRGWCVRAVTDIAIGDTVLVKLSDAGRHMGMVVQETLTEV